MFVFWDEGKRFTQRKVHGAQLSQRKSAHGLF